MNLLKKKNRISTIDAENSTKNLTSPSILDHLSLLWREQLFVMLAYVILLYYIPRGMESSMNNLSGNDFSAIDSLLSLICDLLAVHGAALFLPDGNGYMLAAASNAGSPTPIPCKITQGKGLVGWILRNRQPLIVNTLDEVNRSYLGYYNADAECRITSFLGVPLPNGGALCLDAVGGKHSFTPADQTILARIADIVENQYLIIKENEASAHASACFDVAARIQKLGAETMGWRNYLRTFLDILRDGTRFDYAALALTPENSRSYLIEDETEPLINQKASADTNPSLPLSGGLIGWSYTEGMPVYVEGLDGSPTLPLFGSIQDIPAFQCAVCLPVKHSGIPCGVLVLAAENGRALSTHLRTLIQMAAEILGTQLELLYLRHRLQYSA